MQSPRVFELNVAPQSAVEKYAQCEKGRKSLTVSPQGPVWFHDPDLITQAVLSGLGIGTATEDSQKALIAERRLAQILKDGCPSFLATSSTIQAAAINRQHSPL